MYWQFWSDTFYEIIYTFCHFDDIWQFTNAFNFVFIIFTEHSDCCAFFTSKLSEWIFANQFWHWFSVNKYFSCNLHNISCLIIILTFQCKEAKLPKALIFPHRWYDPNKMKIKLKRAEKYVLVIHQEMLAAMMCKTLKLLQYVNKLKLQNL